MTAAKMRQHLDYHKCVCKSQVFNENTLMFVYRPPFAAGTNSLRNTDKPTYNILSSRAEGQLLITIVEQRTLQISGKGIPNRIYVDRVAPDPGHNIGGSVGREKLH